MMPEPRTLVVRLDNAGDVLPAAPPIKGAGVPLIAAGSEHYPAEAAGFALPDGDDGALRVTEPPVVLPYPVGRSTAEPTRRVATIRAVVRGIR